MKKTVLFIIISAFIAFNYQLSAQQSDSTLKWKALQDSTSFYMEKQDFETALKWGELALPQAEKEFGKMDTNYVKTLGSISEMFYELGNIDSAFYYGDTRLTISRNLFKGDNPSLAESINNMGYFYKSKGDDKNAEILFIEALEMKRRIFNGDNNNLAATINNLAIFYSRRSNYKNAEPLFIESLEMARRLNPTDNENLAEYINNLGNFYNDLSKYKQAETLYKECLEMTRRLNPIDSNNLATVINNLGVFYSNISDNNQAEPLFKEALDIRRHLFKTDNSDLAGSIINLAVCNNKKNDFNLADSLFKEALEMYRHLYNSDNSDLASCLISIGKIYFERSDYKQAEPLFKEALEMNRRLYKSDNIALGLSINNMAKLYDAKGDYKQAETLYKEVLEIYKNIFEKGNPALAMVIDNLAIFYDNLCKYELAESLYKEALDMYRSFFKATEHEDLARSINNVAGFYYDRGEYKLAEPLYQESLAMNRRIFKGDNTSLANNINNVAGFYRGICDYEKARPLYIESLKMYRNIYKDIDQIDLAWSINCNAIFYHSIGDSISAESLYKESLEMYRHIFKSDNKYVAKCISDLAYFYISRGNFKNAETSIREALNMRRRLFTGDHVDILQSISDMAFVYNNQGDYQKAEPLYKVALDMSRRLYKGFHKDLALSIWNMGSIYGKQSRYKEALPLYCESFQVRENIITNYFPSLSETEKKQFLTTLNQAYDRFHSVPCYLININDKELDSVYNNSLKQEYDNLLFSKGILLNSSSKIRNQIMKSGDSSLIDLFNTLRDKRIYISKIYNMTNQQLAEKNINFDSVLNAANDVEKELTKKSDAFAKENDKKIIRWKDVQNSLGKNEAAIELVRFNYYDSKLIRTTDSVFYAALILKHSSDESNKSPDLVLLENGNDLEEKYFAKYSKMIRDLGDEYKSGNKIWKDSFIKGLLKDMYVNFWQKIQEKLVGVKTVYLSVDGVYNKINLNTLVNPETGKYLAEEIDLRIVTSTRDLVKRNMIAGNIQSGNNTAELFGSPKFNLDSNEIQDIAQKYAAKKQSLENNSSNNKLRGIGDTLLRGLGYDELPGTKTEIEKISEILKSKGWTANTHTGKDATEEAVKSVNSPKILHIATHGQFDRDNESSEEQKKLYENPLLKSKLILAGGENTRLKLRDNESVDSGTEHGYLTAYEVMNMNLDNTELVVLSACETGLGEIKNGEGVYGLQRAFQVAGAKSLIMSLWKVPDAPTQELMLSFYSKWLSGMDKREAFRQSQMEFAKKYPNFYYWGAFEIITNY